MKIISFIEEDDVVRKILKYCNLWKAPAQRPPPKIETAPVAETEPHYENFIEPA